MKFKFSVTVTNNEILQAIIKQSLHTRNERKLSNSCQLMKQYKTFNCTVCISINFHSKLNNNNNNLLYKNDFNKVKNL